MIYSQNREQLRAMYFTAWQKYKNQQALEPIEQQIVEVILVHPEYHKMLDNTEESSEKNYFPEMGETNPFLHMGLHLSLRDQLRLDQPNGIHAIYQQLLDQHGDPHQVEHLMIEILAETLFNLQKYGASHFSEQDYLMKLQQLVNN